MIIGKQMMAGAESCSVQTHGALWIERMANEQETENGCRGAARSDFDYRLLDGEAARACQVLHHLPPATSRLGFCHGKRPFSTIGDK